jgi:hypothetical protein
VALRRQALQGDRKLATAVALTGTLCEDRASRLGLASLRTLID